MRTAIKIMLSVPLALLLGAVPAVAAGECGGSKGLLSSVLGEPVKDIKKAGNMPCNSSLYGGNFSTCNTCRQSVEKWKKNIPKAADAASKADCEASLLGSVNSAKAAKDAKQQLTSFKGNGTNVESGRDTQNGRAANATKAKSEFDKCVQDLSKTCASKPLADADRNVAQAVYKACEGGSKGAGDFASQKSKDGMDLNDLAKMMGLAQQAMGLAQQAQGQQSQSDMSGIGATSPTPSSDNSSAPEIQTAKLDNQGSSASPSVGFGNVAASQVGTQGAGITGGGESSGSSSGYDSLAGLGGSGFGAPASGGEVGSSGGGGGLGGGGGSNSTGASRPIDGLAAGGNGAGESGYEVNPGGGRAFVGLKASKSDLDSVADGTLLGGDAKLEELGDRDLASDGDAIDASAEGDSPMLASDSIFMRVRAKYSTLKGSGKI